MWLLVLMSLAWSSGPKVDEGDFQRLKGFKAYQEYLLSLEKQRLAGLSQYKKRSTQIEKDRLADLESHKKRRAKEVRAADENSAEYQQYLKKQAAYEQRLDKQRRDFVVGQERLRKRLSHQAPVTPMQELGLDQVAERVEWNKRRDYVSGFQKSGSGGSSGRSSSPPPISSPPPPPNMDFDQPPADPTFIDSQMPELPEFDGDFPPPPPPPADFFEEAPPPPNFDDAADF